MGQTSKLSAVEWLEARTLWETNRDLSFADIAKKYGLSKQGVAKRANAEGWERVLDKAEITARAQAVADQRLAQRAGINESQTRQFDDDRRLVVVERVKKSEKLKQKVVDKVVDAVTTDNLPPPVQPQGPQALSVVEALPEVQAAATRSDTVPSTPEERSTARRDASVEIVATVLDRHRREWSAARALSIEAIRDRNFDKAKLAKITAETIGIIQAGERKAYGIEDSDKTPVRPTVVVVERGGVRRILNDKDS